MELFKQNNHFKGVFSQPSDQRNASATASNFELLITDSDANEKTFNGQITWTQINNSKTKVKGKYYEDNAYLVEYELIEGSGVSFPTIYEGKIISSSISGIAKHANYHGTFYLEIKDSIK
jgi:hypothetical protein